MQQMHNYQKETSAYKISILVGCGNRVSLDDIKFLSELLFHSLTGYKSIIFMFLFADFTDCPSLSCQMMYVVKISL